MDNQTNSVPIRLFSQRSILYKMGFFIIFLSFLMYVYSFSSLDWLYISDEETFDQYSEGLWSDCRSQCKLLLAIRVMSCICLGGYIATIASGIYDNCRLVPPDYHSRKFEWFALFTGTVGLIMDLIYMLIYYIRRRDAHLSMDFTLNFTAILILFACLTFIACKNRNPQAARGMVISSPPPMVLHYSQGQPYSPFVQPAQASYVPGQNDPLFPQHHYPPYDPPPYSLPPEYPGDCIKA